MIEERTTSSAWMRGVAKTLQQHGLDSPALFKEAGLSIDNLDDPDFRWPTEEESRLWTLAAERSGNPDIGLFNPHLPRPDQYGIVGYVMMSSPDLLTGFTRFIRYICLVSDAVTIALEPGDGGRWVGVLVHTCDSSGNGVSDADPCCFSSSSLARRFAATAIGI